MYRILVLVFLFCFSPVWAFDPVSFHQVLDLDLDKNHYNFDYIQKEWGPAIEVGVGDAIATRKEMAFTTRNKSEYLIFKTPECERGWVLETAKEYKRDNPADLKVRIIDAKGMRWVTLGGVHPPRLMKYTTLKIKEVHLGMNRRALESLFPTKGLTNGYTVQVKKSGHSDRYEYTHQKTGKDSDNATPWVREDAMIFIMNFDSDGRLVRFEVSNMDCG